MRSRIALMLLAAGFTTLTALTTAHAQSSTSTVTYQGVLTQNGTPVADGAYTLTFKIYDAANAGNVVETIPVSGVQTTQGRFAALVPVTPSTFNGSDRWWSVTFSGTELPRQKVTATPYAVSSLAVAQPASTSGPQLSQHRLMLGSETTGSSNLVFQINNPNTPSARAVIQGVHSQGNAFSDLFLNPAGGIVYLWKDCIIGSDATGDSNFRIIANSQSTDLQAIRSSGSAYGDIRINPTAGDVTVAPHGTTVVRVLTITGGSDVAEPVAITTTEAIRKAEPGMVMVIDRDHDGKLVPCSAAYDRTVAGVLSGANCLKPGMVLSAEGQQHTGAGADTMPLAMTGRVWVLCDATHGAISRGDSLTTSATPGHAMVVTDDSRAARTVIGKAMTELKEGKGLVLVLVNLQ